LLVYGCLGAVSPISFSWFAFIVCGLLEEVPLTGRLTREPVNSFSRFTIAGSGFTTADSPFY
jgi:hypothetical protein